MKSKHLTKILALFVAGVSIFSFAGCGGNGSHGSVEHKHSYAYTDNGDGTHRGVCNGAGECDEPAVTEAHVYDGDTDATCNKCSYVRDIGGIVIGHDPVYKWTDNGDGTHNGSCTVIGCDGTHNVTGEAHVYDNDGDTECNNCHAVRDVENPDPPPVIVNKDLKGAVKIIGHSADELEAAYVTWEIDANAKWYNVYIKASNSNNYVRLDAPLVRKYSTCFRADAVGLAKGTYDFKVIPVQTDGTEADEKYSAEAKSVPVKAHQRFGYAFIDGNVPGAYNTDGTLKANAQVVYVTAATAKTVTATVDGVEVTGFQSILDARQKKIEQSPLCFRIVGTVTKDDLDHISSSAEGLQIKGASASYPAENITIEGIGSDGTIKDFGMLLRNCRNDEVRNLGILNCMDDGISIDTDNSHLWIHNNDIFYGKSGSGDKAKGDGALDTKESTLITHSFNHFWDCGKCNLQGMTSETTDNRITYHHNWYDHSDSRHPRVRTATVHVFNNYFDGNSKYGVGATMGSSVFVENNYFRSTTSNSKPMMIAMQGTDILGNDNPKGTFSGEDGGIIKAFGNTYDIPNLKLIPYSTVNNIDFDCYEASSRDEKVPSSVTTKAGGTSYNNFDTASDFYKYEVETAEQAKETVQRYAGRIDGGDLKYEFNNEVDDPDYSVNTELKSMVTNYKSSVVAIGEITGGSVTPPNGGDNPGTDPDNPDNPDNPVVPPAGGSITCTFEGGKASDSAITVSGNEKKGVSVTVNAINKTFTSGLKLESATSVKFTLTEKMTLTLYLDGSAGQRVKIDGTSYNTASVGGDLVVTVTLEAGAHEITKGDSINLYYLVLSPA